MTDTKQPWSDEATPLADELDKDMADQGQMTRASYWRNHAKAIERQMRHAEKLLAESIAGIHPGLRTVMQEKIAAHLEAAKQEDAR